MFKFNTRRLGEKMPFILSVLASLGVVATAVSAVKATPKAKQRIGIATMNKERTLSKTEMFIAAAPAYIPTACIAAGTIACIFGSNSLNQKQKASLLAAYTLVRNYHKKYTDTLKELHGEEADKEVRTAMAREYCDFHATNLDVPDEKVMFYDELSGQTFVRYEREVMDAEYHLNRNFVLRGYAYLNEFYEFLGINTMDFGDVLGWDVSDGYMWVDFEHKLLPGDGGTDICRIDYVFSPHDITEYC